MIGIDRSGTPSPDKLRTDGEADLPRIRALAEAGILKSDDFDRDIYGSPEVKTTLWGMQHRKCCYCEREYERKYSGVEHFRPKTNALRDDGAKTPGYWWLAYWFDNLYFGCPIAIRPRAIISLLSRARGRWSRKRILGRFQNPPC